MKGAPRNIETPIVREIIGKDRGQTCRAFRCIPVGHHDVFFRLLVSHANSPDLTRFSNGFGGNPKRRSHDLQVSFV